MADRKLVVKIIGDESSLQRSFLAGSRGARQFESSVSGSLGRITIGIGTLVKSFVVIEGLRKALEGLNETVHLGIDEFKENAAVQAQTQAVLKSTGGVAHIIAGQVDELGLKLSNLSGVNDEIVRLGENTLLAFTNIRNFAGTGNQIFDEATKSALDFSVRTGRGIQASAIAIGRALQDPAKAAQSLRRAYIVLTSAEKTQIAVDLRHHDVLAAQRDIIADLEKRYGGAAKAAGQTLGGALNVLKERFQDLAGQGIGTVTPALTRAVKGLTAFVVQLTQAKTLKARFHIAVEGLETLGRDLVTATQSGLGRVKGLGAVVAARVREEFSRIDWRKEITDVAQAIGKAVADNLQRLNEAIRRVDWNKVGQEIAKGVGLAVGAAAVFIKNLNVGRIAKALADVLGAALIAIAEIMVGVGEAIGKAVVRGIGKGLQAAGAAVERLAVGIVLKIIEPFTHLPGFLGGGPFRKMKEGLQQTLASMQAAGAVGGAAVGQAITASMAAALAAGLAAVQQEAVAGARQAAIAAAGAAAQAGKAAAPPSLPQPPTVVGPQATGLTATQKNTFFDNQIARILLRGGLGSIQQQVAALQQADTLIAARLQATKDVTRRLNLEDQLLQNQAQIKSLQQQGAAAGLQTRQDAMAEFIANLQLGVSKALATADFRDDLAALKRLQAGISLEIREFGKTADLAGQLLDVQQQIKDTVVKQRDAAQFFTLGLSPTGDDRVPLVKTLQRQLRNVSASVAGTFLDTNKTRSVLANIKKVLSAGINNVSIEVRSKIREMLEGIQQQLKDHAGNLTRFRHTSTAALLAGLGLDRETLRILQQRLAQIGVHGTVPGARSLAFSGAGAGSTQVNLVVDGRTLATVITPHQQRAGQRRTTSRRGPYAGRN